MAQAGHESNARNVCNFHITHSGQNIPETETRQQTSRDRRPERFLRSAQAVKNKPQSDSEATGAKNAHHLLPPTTATFEMLSPRLQPGGRHTIEDWSGAHIWERVTARWIQEMAATVIELQPHAQQADDDPG